MDGAFFSSADPLAQGNLVIEDVDLAGLLDGQQAQLTTGRAFFDCVVHPFVALSKRSEVDGAVLDRHSGSSFSSAFSLNRDRLLRACCSRALIFRWRIRL